MSTQDLELNHKPNNTGLSLMFGKKKVPDVIFNQYYEVENREIS